MNSSQEVAMTIIEPGGRRWAQLLNVYWPIRDLLPLIISRLDLPERINYQLYHARLGHTLREQDPLFGTGSGHGRRAGDPALG